MTVRGGVVMGRKKYLDAAKGVGINMIMFGHITSLGNPVDRWMGLFKVTIFFIVSGYLMALNRTPERYSIKAYAKRHAGSLMIPYMIYSILIMAYNVGRYLFIGKTWHYTLGKLRDLFYATVTFRGISTMWFLPCLFLGQLIFLAWLQSPKPVRVVLFFLPVFTTQILEKCILSWEKAFSAKKFMYLSYPVLTVSKSLVAFWFVAVGYGSFFVLSKIKNVWLRFGTGVILSGLTIFISRYKGSTDLNNLYIGKHPEIFYLGGIMGALGVVLILEYLERYLKLTFLTWCGENSLTLMATHGTLGFKNVMIAGFSSVYELAKTVTFKYYLEAIGIQAHLLLLECGVVSIVHHYFPILEGKRQIRRAASK